MRNTSLLAPDRVVLNITDAVQVHVLNTRQEILLANVKDCL